LISEPFAAKFEGYVTLNFWSHRFAKSRFSEKEHAEIARGSHPQSRPEVRIAYSSKARGFRVAARAARGRQVVGSCRA